MNSKELFTLIDNIDERFIDEAWGDDNEVYSDIDIDYDSDRRKGVKVVLEHRPFSIFTPVIVTAACMLLFVAGGFTALNIFRGGLLQPTSRVDNPASYIESSESSELDTSSEPSESTTSDESSEPDESIDSSEDPLINQPITDLDGEGFYELYHSMPPGGEAHSDAKEKMNNRGFAIIEVKETNATGDHPIIAQILKSYPKGGMEPISDVIYITGPGTYEIPYSTLRGAGSFSYLYLSYPGWKDNYEDNIDHFAVIYGTWSP